MIARDHCFDTLLGRFPGFGERWRAHREAWGDEEPGLCKDMSEFGRYVRDLVIAGDEAQLRSAFDFLEELMARGDSDVRDAAATCCLENLINYAAAGDLPAEGSVGLLGPRSRAFCRAWDEFTGTRTPGL